MPDEAVEAEVPNKIVFIGRYTSRFAIRTPVGVIQIDLLTDTIHVITDFDSVEVTKASETEVDEDEADETATAETTSAETEADEEDDSEEFKSGFDVIIVDEDETEPEVEP